MTGRVADGPANGPMPDPSAERIEVCVLGPLLVGPSGLLERPAARQQRRLLALLAISTSANRGLSLEEIAEVLYHGTAERGSRNVATALWRLRQAIGKAAVAATPAGYLLDPSRCDLDLVAFENRVADGRAKLRAGEFEAANTALGSALDLWRGPPLEDLNDQVEGQATAAALEELRFGALEDRAEALAAIGAHDEAIGLLESLVATEAAREHAWALLVASWAATGRPDLARRAGDLAVHHLASHGLEPGAELATTIGRLVQPSAPQAHPAPPPGTNLIGREAEQAELQHAVLSAFDEDRLTFAVVTGEAGVGKTALLTELAGACAGTATVLTLRCENRLELPYEALEPWFEHLGAVPEGASPALVALHRDSELGGESNATGAALAAEISRWIETASSAPVLVGLDDAHWATGAVVQVLRELQLRGRAKALAVVVFAREQERGRRRADWLELVSHADVRLTLGPLDEHATGLLLGSDDAQVVAQAHRLSGGNPLILTQLAKVDPARWSSRRWARLSASLNEAIGARLQDLDPEVVAALRVAAVAGPAFRRATVLAALHRLGASFDDADDALRAGIEAGLLQISGDGETCQFVHGLVADHLYRQLGASERSEAHHAVGLTLDRLHDSGPRPVADLAHHFGLAWPACTADVASSYLRGAGQHAAAQLDFGRARTFYHRALTLLSLDDDADPRLVGELLELAARAAADDGDLPAGQALLSRLETVGRQNDDLGLRLRAATGLVHTYSTSRVDQLSVDRLGAAVEEAAARPGLVQPPIVAEAVATWSIYRPDDARRVAEELPVDQKLAAAVLPRLWEQQEPAQQAHTAALLADLRDVDPHRVWLRQWVTDLTCGAAHWDRPPPRPAGASPDLETRIELTLWEICVATTRGHVDRAEHLIEQCRRNLADPGLGIRTAGWLSKLAGQAIHLAVFRGNLRGTLQHAAVLPPTHAPRHGVMPTVAAYMGALSGDTSAHAACDDLVDELVNRERPAGDFLARTVMLADACWMCGHAAGVRACREALTSHADEHAFLGTTLYWGSVRRSLGHLAIAEGNLDEAIDTLSTAVADYERIGAALFEARTRRDLADVLWQRAAPGDRALAEDHHQAELAFSAPRGLRPVLDRPWPPAAA